MYKDSEKFLLFREADNNTSMYPVSALEQIEGGTDAIVMNFKGPDTDVDTVVITVTADTEVETIKDIVRLINGMKAKNDGAMIVHDKVTGKSCSKNITNIAIG